MKKEPTSDFLKELSQAEYLTINGGESAWYWIAYGAGVASREARELVIDVYIFAQTNRPYGLM